jgi:hypothetical protein
MTPRRNPELAPISTGNLTECNMLATVEIGNAYCELDAHNKVREKFPDAINNTAPQDGDEQVVPITRRPASFVQEDVKVETTVIIESARLEAEAPELYEWPQMEKIDMFMEDDLESHTAYILVVPDAPSGRGGHVYVWVGQSWRSDGNGESPEEDDNGHRTSEEHWVIIGQDLLKQWQLRLDMPVKVN